LNKQVELVTRPWYRGIRNLHMKCVWLWQNRCNFVESQYIVSDQVDGIGEHLKFQIIDHNFCGEGDVEIDGLSRLHVDI